MKRRDFLIGTSALVGAGIPVLAQAQTRPCPPSRLSIEGGSTASTACTTTGAEADWVQRSTGAGVIWCHDFRSDAEVNAFRWTGGYRGGNDPQAIGSDRASRVRRITTDGIGGGSCLEIFRAAGTQETGSHWWRPLSPIVGSGNGRGIDDAGANGAIEPLPYAATDGGSQISQWTRGYYGHSSYHTGNTFDGSEYYLQMRIRTDPRRAAPGMPTVGKLTIQTRTDHSFTQQELTTYSGGLNANNPGVNYFRIYGGGDTNPLESKAASGSGNQPGNEAGVCTLSSSPNRCWAWSGGWDTVMYHFIIGRGGVAESHLRVYAAHEGETSYTKIWDQVWANRYDGAPRIPGYNAFICNTYNNGNNCPNDFWQRYTQLIFSRAFIPCPQV